MALDEITDAKLPFGMGEIDLLSMSGAFAVIALVLGATVWNLADAVGQNFASSVAQFIGNITGINPATGGDSSGDVV